MMKSMYYFPIIGIEIHAFSIPVIKNSNINRLMHALYNSSFCDSI